MIESELLLTRNKVVTLETSNKQAYAELAAVREQLKTVQDTKKISEDALAEKEQEQQHRFQIVTKLPDDNLNAIAASIKSLTVDVFGK
jgi:hypothetical protein